MQDPETPSPDSRGQPLWPSSTLCARSCTVISIFPCRKYSGHQGTGTTQRARRLRWAPRQGDVTLPPAGTDATNSWDDRCAAPTHFPATRHARPPEPPPAAHRDGAAGRPDRGCVPRCPWRGATFYSSTVILAWTAWDLGLGVLRCARSLLPPLFYRGTWALTVRGHCRILGVHLEPALPPPAPRLRVMARRDLSFFFFFPSRPSRS